MDHWFSLTSSKTTVVAVLVPWLGISYPIKLFDSGRIPLCMISSWWVITKSRQGIKQLGVSFCSISFYFPLKVAEGHVHSSEGKSLVPIS